MTPYVPINVGINIMGPNSDVHGDTLTVWAGSGNPPEVTAEIRAKVFGLNAAKPYGIEPREIEKHIGVDPVQRARAWYEGREDPAYLTYGPRTRREFFDLLRLGGG